MVVCRHPIAEDISNCSYILTSPKSSSGVATYECLDDDRRGNSSDSFLSFAGFAFFAFVLIVAFAELLYATLSTPPGDLAELEELIEVRIRPPGAHGEDQAPLIPQRLVFIYKDNSTASSVNGSHPFDLKDPLANVSRVINPKVDALPFEADDPLASNVMQTIEKYQNLWKAGPNQHLPKDKTEEEGTMMFLSDYDCLGVISKAEPRLVRHYLAEREQEYKVGICRSAALYLYGGYNLDVELGVVEPVNLDSLDIPEPSRDPRWQLRALKTKNNALSMPRKDDFVTFAAVYNRQGLFSRGFTAAAPRHPVLKRSLDYMVDFYEHSLEDSLPQMVIYSHRASHTSVPSTTQPVEIDFGAYTLTAAHQSTPNHEWEEYVSSLTKDHQYSIEQEPKRSFIVTPKRKYSRFLYEISLEEDEVQRSGIFRDVPLQDAEYEEKAYCNYICFGGHKAYFYSRAPGSKGCPLEKR